MPKPCPLLAAALILSAAPALAQPTLPASIADLILEGTQPGGSFGTYIAAAGDADGDGYDDVLIGFPEGRLTLHRGSASGLSTTPAWTLEGSGAFPVGDVNGDGFDDVLVSDTTGHQLRLFTGSAAGHSSTAWVRDGGAAGGGDVNGDGLSDVAILNRFVIEIFHGSATGLGQTPSTSVQSGGNSILDDLALADVSGDGFADLAFTSRKCVKGCIALMGRLSVHLGSAEGVQTRVKRTIDFSDGEVLPFVTSAGDMDGDGFGDLAVTLIGDLASGCGACRDEVLLFSGSRSGIRSQYTLLFQRAGHSLEPEQVRGGGDINGDGLADLLVPEGNEFVSGALDLMIFAGSAAGVSAVPSTVIEADQQDDGFPTWPSGVGDVNGDGLADIIAGAPEFESGGVRLGRVYVFHGRPSF